MPQQTNAPSAAAVNRFWQWFIANDQRLFHFEDDQDATFNALTTSMHAVDSDITFEFGPVEDGKRDFVISAGGIRRAFDAVRQLADAAPPLARWRVIAFRPRRPVGYIIDFDGIRVDPAKVSYSLLTSQTDVGIYLFIPGYAEEDSRYGQAGFLLLDQLLGEYDVETKIGLIRMFAPEAETPGPRYPVTELPGHFDDVYRQLMTNRDVDNS